MNVHASQNIIKPLGDGTLKVYRKLRRTDACESGGQGCNNPSESQNAAQWKLSERQYEAGECFI